MYLTMRDETEWVETLEGGWNRLASPNLGNIASAALEVISDPPSKKVNMPFGNGRASEKILDLLIAGSK